MGIRGFTSFLSNYYDRDFFEDYHLKNCQLVIDGNNLRHLLFLWCPHTNSCFGGDYETYRNYISLFFKRLHLCNVRATVVLDGAHDQSAIKLKTCLRRAREQARNSTQMSLSNRKNSVVLPAFSYDVFVHVCQEFNIELVQTNFEADSYIALLAAERGCPLLSNDSDFFVQSSVPFLPLDLLPLQVTKGNDNEYFLPCKRFVMAKFLKHFNISSLKFLHLMASILGNDYIPAGSFQRFFAQIQLPKKKRMSQRHKVMEGLLKWLGRESSIEQALSKIFDTIPKADRDKLREKLEASMAMYSSENSMKISAEQSETQLSTFQGMKVPEWLAKDFRHGNLSPWLKDVLCNRLVFMQNQVENRQKISSHLFIKTVFERTCHLLTALDSDHESTVKVYVRSGTTSKAHIFQFIGDCEPSLQELRVQNEEAKMKYIFSVLELPEKLGTVLLEQSRDTLKLWLLGLFAWTSRLTCISVLDIKVLFLGRYVVENYEANPTLAEVKKRFSSKPRELLEGKFKQFDLDFVHTLADLQAVFFHLLSLAALINCQTLLRFPIWKWWNGTLLFNLHSDVNSFRDLNRIEVLLKNDEKLISELNAFMEKSFLFCENVTSEISFKGKRRTRYRKKQNSKNTEAKVEPDSLENKFSLLNVEDTCSD